MNEIFLTSIIIILLGLGWFFNIVLRSSYCIFFKAYIQRHGYTEICVGFIAIMAFLLAQWVQNLTQHVFLQNCIYAVDVAEILSFNPEFVIYTPIFLLAYIPIAIGLYYFYYRIQRSVSESYMLRFDLSFTNLFCCFFLIFSCIREGTITGKVTLYGAIILLCFTIWSCFFAIGIFRRLHIQSFLKLILHRLKSLIVIYFKLKNKSLKVDIYQELEWNFDILYQIIEHSIIKSVDAVYLDEINVIKSMLADVSRLFENVVEHATVIDHDCLFKNNDIGWNSSYDKAFQKELETCTTFTKNLLRNHKKVCILLYEKYRNNEYNEMWRGLLEFYPRIKSENMGSEMQQIINEFFRAFWSFAVYFSERDRDKLQDILRGINKFAESRPERINHILLLRALIVRAIDKGNLSLLTEICYLQEILIDRIRKMKREKRLYDQNHELNKYIAKDIVDEKDNAHYYQGMNLYVLFQAAIKSIELGQYMITGFLVKYIVSHYSPEDIGEICKKIRKHSIVNDNKLKMEKFYERLGIEFNINDKTADYFLKKLVILIRLQQNFRYHDDYRDVRLSFSITRKYLKSTSSYAEFDLDYCLEKIIHVGKDYGLLSVVKFVEKWEKSCEKCKKIMLQEFY